MRSDAWRSSKAATSPLRFNLLRTCAAFVVVFLAPCEFFLEVSFKFCVKTGTVLANSVAYVACALFSEVSSYV